MVSYRYKVAKSTNLPHPPSVRPSVRPSIAPPPPLSRLVASQLLRASTKKKKRELRRAMRGKKQNKHRKMHQVCVQRIMEIEENPAKSVALVRPRVCTWPSELNRECWNVDPQLGHQQRRLRPETAADQTAQAGQTNRAPKRSRSGIPASSSPRR